MIRRFDEIMLTKLSKHDFKDFEKELRKELFDKIDDAMFHFNCLNKAQVEETTSLRDVLVDIDEMVENSVDLKFEKEKMLFKKLNN